MQRSIRHKDARSRVLAPDALARVLKDSRRRGQKIVITNGCFDLIHAGHLKVLESCKKMGDVLVVALNTDASVRRLKGPKRPLLPLKERAALMAALRPVDYVTFFGEDTPAQLYKLLRPDILVKGGDWTSDQIAGREYAGHVARIPLVKGRSTSGIIEMIAKRYG